MVLGLFPLTVIVRYLHSGLKWFQSDPRQLAALQGDLPPQALSHLQGIVIEDGELQAVHLLPQTKVVHASGRGVVPTCTL